MARPRIAASGLAVATCGARDAPDASRKTVSLVLVSPSTLS
jgi:hypothetical protein